VSRAVRAPSRIDRDFFLPSLPPFIIAGGDGFESEVANVFEVGHRGQQGSNFTYSATLFRQHYSGLRAGRGVPAVVANRIDGHSQGLEAWAQWQPHDAVRLGLGFLGQRKKLHMVDPPADPSSIPNLGNDPDRQWKLRARFDLPGRTELDLHLRRVGALPSPFVPAYTALDARLAWQVTPRVELSLLGQNLLDRRHHEFESAATAAFLARRVYLRMVLQL
jgi:iron complex outermembrane receptor protein